jgi:hypothetical protein
VTDGKVRQTVRCERRQEKGEEQENDEERVVDLGGLNEWASFSAQDSAELGCERFPCAKGGGTEQSREAKGEKAAETWT